MSGTLTEDQYIDRVFGVSYTRPNAPLRRVAAGGKKPTNLPAPPPPGQRRRSQRDRVVAPPPVDLNRFDVDGDDGKKIVITKDASGRTIYTAPPPPVREINFSGGGAKGAALPGALKAMEDAHILDTVNTINGASVGAITAALLAAGISAEYFKEISNSDDVTKILTDGTGGSKTRLAMAAVANRFKNGSFHPLTGEGIEGLMSTLLDSTVRASVEEFVDSFKGAPQGIDPKIQSMLEGILVEMNAAKDGPTFGQMSKLAAIVPKIKEVQITGTYTTEYEDNNGQKGKKVAGSNENGKLYLFNAQSEPDLPISVAVHASASFPLAFKPVNIKLSNGKMVRFIDGGTVNNTPTSQSLEQDRGLDPMPDDRAMTFIFETKPPKSMADKVAFWRSAKESSSKKALKGEAAAPGQGYDARIANSIIKTANTGLDYGVSVVVTDRPRELIEVPLKLDEKIKRKYWLDKKVDERDGTLNFAMPLEVKKMLQAQTEKATQDHIEREGQPRTQEFKSDAQMFCSIPLADLKAVAKSGYNNAAAAVAFREDAAKQIAILVGAVQTHGDGDMAALGAKAEVRAAIAALDKLAGKDPDFQGYVARELNKGPLDQLLLSVRKSGLQSDILAPTFFVADAVMVHKQAADLLKKLIYPKLGMERTGGAATEVLLIVQGLLRAARTADDFNAALDIAIDHFYGKSDLPPLPRGHRAFALELMANKMKV